MSVGGSLDSGSRYVKVDFAHDTASPLLITVQEADEILIQATVVLETAFDDAAATLDLGTVATPGCIFDTTELKPEKTGEFLSQATLTATLATTIQLVITPGTATQGDGYVFLHLAGV
jgi:hypothetical protein